MRAQGSHGRVTSAALLAVACAALLFAGCTQKPAVQGTLPVTVATSTVAATDTPLATETATETVPAAAEPTAAPPPPPPAKKLPYKPGPDETGVNYAYVRKMVLDNGYVYVTVDYILIGEGPDGVVITNDNPKLRTFPLAATCPCRYLSTAGGAELSAPLTPTAYRTKWKNASSGSRIRKNPYKLTVKHGVVTKFDNAYLP